MKQINKVLIIMATTLTVAFAACTKPEEPSRLREIYYTHTYNPTLTLLTSGGDMVQLDTESAWDELLDRFCDYAAAGEQVTFYSHTPSSTKDNTTTPTTITTSSRDELKQWMKEMERSGRTVNVTFDDNTGTWNGTAYANLGGTTAEADVQTYIGSIELTPMPALEQPPLGGAVLALLTDTDSTLILAFHGMMIWIEDTNNVSIISDTDIAIEGCVSTHYDLNGNTFMVLEVSDYQHNEITF